MVRALRIGPDASTRNWKAIPATCIWPVRLPRGVCAMCRPTPPSVTDRMALDTTNSDLTQALEDAAQRLRALAAEAERQASAAATRGRREGEVSGVRRWTERTNQAIRRMRQAPDPDAWGQVLAEAAGAACAAVLRRQGDALKLVGLHGDYSHTVASALRDKGLSTKSIAPALASALETQDAVVAHRSASEVSNELIELFPQCAAPKAQLIPLTAKRQVTGLLYLLAGDQPLDVNALELLATLAEAAWQDRSEPAAAKSTLPLLQIAPV